jgi:hypothetical protein
MHVVYIGSGLWSDYIASDKYFLWPKLIFALV